MLNIDNLHVYRGKTYVLKGVDLHVNAGEIVALIGANGAGKTTVLRAISGLLRPQNGHIQFQTAPHSDPIDLSALPAEKIVSHGICHCPEGRGIFARLTVRENLMLGAYLRRDTPQIQRDRDEITDLFPILKTRFGQTAGNLSGGEQEMLAIGRALMSRPRLLMLDEPSLGLAPVVVQTLFETLRKINRRGVTLLLVEQNAVMALELSDRAYVMETGRIALSGSSNDLAANDAVRRAYLGGRR